MILIPKKGSNEIKYDSELAKKLDYVIIVNDIDSSNVGDLFSIWNQKCKVTICNDITDYYDFIKKEKKFNPNLMRDLKDQSSAGQIARLPLYHRTPAFLWQPGEEWGNVNFAIWYVRIRDIKKTESPYAGVVKVEKMLMTGHEAEYGLSTDEIDTITANIINERNPVCYGTDARWANHLYPVYMTECYCKNRFKSDYYFMNLF